MKDKLFLKGLIIIFGILLVWWIRLQYLGVKDQPENFYFNAVSILLFLLAAIVGWDRSRYWGGLKSIVGRFLGFLSLGMFSWAAGNAVWSYYNLIAKTEIPYPSLADFFYLLIIPLMGYGLVYLIWAFKHKTFKAVYLLSILIPVIVFVFSYWFFAVKEGLFSGGLSLASLTGILDLAYPAGDTILLSLILIIPFLYFSYWGGFLRKTVFILSFGLFLQVVGDFGFSWTTAKGTYFNGNWTDMTYIFASFVIGLAFYYAKELENPKEKNG